MALLEPNRDLLEYYSGDAIDKIVYQDTINLSMPAPVGYYYTDSDQIVEQTVPNPYGKACMVRFKWRIDGGNNNAQDAVLQYSFSIDASPLGGPVNPAEPGCLGAVVVGVNATEIRFRAINGHHSNVTYTTGADSFTGYAHTFTIDYVLYEVD